MGKWEKFGEMAMHKALGRDWGRGTGSGRLSMTLLEEGGRKEEEIFCGVSSAGQRDLGREARVNRGLMRVYPMDAVKSSFISLPKSLGNFTLWTNVLGVSRLYLTPWVFISDLKVTVEATQKSL